MLSTQFRRGSEGAADPAAHAIEAFIRWYSATGHWVYDTRAEAARTWITRGITALPQAPAHAAAALADWIAADTLPALIARLRADEAAAGGAVAKNVTLRIARAAAELASSARFARIMDPETNGRISYSAMCGGIEAVVTSLVRDLAGREAGDALEKAFKDVYDDDTPEARAIIERAERRESNLRASRRPFPQQSAEVPR